VTINYQDRAVNDHLCVTFSQRLKR